MYRLDRRSRRELRELADDVAKFHRLVEIECRHEFQTVAGSVANEARNQAPRLTGRLRASITPGADATVSAGVPYAAILDGGGQHPVFGRGSVFQPPTYFLTNAAESHDRELMDAADEAVSTAAREIGFH